MIRSIALDPNNSSSSIFFSSMILFAKSSEISSRKKWSGSSYSCNNVESKFGNIVLNSSTSVITFAGVLEIDPSNSLRLGTTINFML